MILASILSIILYMIHLIVKHLNSVRMRKSLGLRQKCYVFLCTGKVDKNVLQLTRPVEKKIANGVKRKVKDDHTIWTCYIASSRMPVSKI